MHSVKASSFPVETADHSGKASSLSAETTDCSGKAFCTAETTEPVAVPLTDRYYRWCLVRDSLEI